MDSLSRIRTEVRENAVTYLVGQELLPVLNDALAEIKQGSALQAKAILEALKEVFE